MAVVPTVGTDSVMIALCRELGVDRDRVTRIEILPNGLAKVTEIAYTSAGDVAMNDDGPIFITFNARMIER